MRRIYGLGLLHYLKYFNVFYYVHILNKNKLKYYFIYDSDNLCLITCKNEHILSRRYTWQGNIQLSARKALSIYIYIYIYHTNIFFAYFFKSHPFALRSLNDISSVTFRSRDSANYGSNINIGRFILFFTCHPLSRIPLGMLGISSPHSLFSSL